MTRATRIGASDGAPDSEALRQASRLLGVDAATAQAVTAMRKAGLRPILLKGPAFGSWLYESRHQRPYADVDLLVAPADFGTAAKVLTELGYRSELPARWLGITAIDSLGHAQAFRRAGAWPAEVDLHRSLPYTRPEARTWRILESGRESILVGGCSVEVLRPGARALLVGLHAAHHGSGPQKPVLDVERALKLLEDATWREAAALAWQLDVAEAFAVGLRLTAAGGELADRLGLPAGASAPVRLRGSEPIVAEAIRHLQMQEPLLRRFLLLLARIIPSPEWVRMGYPSARAGRIALGRGYVRRWIVLASRIPQVLAAARAENAERSRSDKRS